MSQIILKDINFSYGNIHIFKNLNQKFAGPGLNIILGRSGSGKSTLLALIADLLKPESGTIEISPSAKPAVVLQSPLLLDYLTLEENVSISCALNGSQIENDEIHHIFKLLKIEDLLNRYPKEVSGGEMMRASIARALICKNEIIIMDEPTGQLDDKNSWEIYKILQKLAKDHLILLVTHDEKASYKIADNLYLLEHGTFKLLKSKAIAEQKEKRRENTSSGLSFTQGLKITKKYLKTKKLRVILSVIFLAFALSLLYLGINLRLQFPDSIKSLMNQFYTYNTVEIYKEDTITSSSSHLTLKRREALTENELKQLKIEESYPCLSYFLSEQREIYFHGKTSAIRILPCFEQSTAKLAKGHPIQEHDQIIVNKSFLEVFNLSFEDIQNDELFIDENKIIYLKELKSTDIYNKCFNFHIVGLAAEKELFNTPTIYYAYHKIYDELNKIYLPNISKEIGELITITDLFYITNNMSDDFRSQKTLINIADPIFFYQEIKEIENISINSKVIEAHEASDTIISSLTIILVIFLFLFLISALNLEFLAIYSLYDENIRLFALLALYKGSKKNKNILAICTLVLFFVQTFILSSILSMLSTVIINNLTNAFDYPHLLKFFDTISFIIVNMFSLAISFIASSLPLKRIKAEDVKKELEGEE